MAQVIVLVQARMNSTRFPSKVLAQFCCLPMLVYQVRRFQQAGWRTGVLCPRGEEALLALRRQGMPVHQVYGNPNDVLGRYARYARAMVRPGTVIARVCADCPLVCPYLLRDILAHWQATPGLAYLGMGPGWPDGLGDYDLFTREALLQMDAEATLPSDREHVVPWAWKNSDRFPQATYPALDWVHARQWPKLSVDTPEDLAYVKQVAQVVTAQCGEAYTWLNVLSTIETTPALQRHYAPMNEAYTAQAAQEQDLASMTWEEARYRLDT